MFGKDFFKHKILARIAGLLRVYMFNVGQYYKPSDVKFIQATVKNTVTWIASSPTD